MSKAQIKHIQSLSRQKYRREHSLCLVEGPKLLVEWFKAGRSIHLIACTEEFYPQLPPELQSRAMVVPADAFNQLSQLLSPQGVLIVCPIPGLEPPPVDQTCLILDEIQDPGNLGTIIRIADWFGIRHLVLGEGCADPWAPKVIQAAMGGHLRVLLHEAKLSEFLPTLKIPMLAATLSGSSIFQIQPPEAAALLIGNEGRGINENLLSLASIQLTIPRLGGAESLNAAVSTGILTAWLTRPGSGS